MKATPINPKKASASMTSVPQSNNADLDKGRNDFDFLVEMDVSPTSSRARRWLQLADGLESLLGKPVDLASSTALCNPFFIESINQDKTPIYERA